MYVVRWKEDKDYFNGKEDDFCWAKDKKEAKLFSSKEEAVKFITAYEPHWPDKIVVEYTHPYNLNHPK